MAREDEVARLPVDNAPSHTANKELLAQVAHLYEQLAALVQKHKTCLGIPHPRSRRGTPSPNLGEGAGVRAKLA
jgi:hypothetical protein